MKKIFLFLFFIIIVFSTKSAFAANLLVNPASGVYEVGDKVVVKVMVSSKSPINAISGVLNIPTSFFNIECISRSGSVLNFWVKEPTFNAGLLSFEGVALNGFSGGTKIVATVMLRAKSAGTANLSFKNGQILAYDGVGTDITNLLTGATFSIKEATIKPVAPKIEPELIQPLPTLKAPQILLGIKYGTPSILGTSDYSKAQTLVTFTAESGAKVFIFGTAEADGSFNVIVPSSLKSGIYTVTAVMVMGDKTNSEISNAIIIKVGNIFSDIGWQIWLVIVFLILLVIYLFIRLHFHFWKDQNSDCGINKKKLRGVEDVVRKSFDILLEDVTECGNDKLTIAEHKHVTEIKKDIFEAEKIIEKKIKDIESEK